MNALKKRILVLGGRGFVGKSLVAELKKTGYEPITASRSTGLNLNDFDNTKEYLERLAPEIIFNCAAHVGSVHYVSNHAAEVFHDNALMALNLYRAISKINPNIKVINPLSNCSYPGSADRQTEEGWWNGEVHDSVFSYGNAKKFVYVTAKCYAKQYGIKTVNFLIPNTFGPGDYTDPNRTHALNGMIIRMIEAKKQNISEFEIWGTGKPVREWAYIGDVARILVDGISTELDLTYPINFAQGKGYSIKESAEFIAKAVGFTGNLVFNTKYQDGAMIKILDDNKFRSVFPDFKFFDHQKGIEETVKYYQDQLR